MKAIKTDQTDKNFGPPRGKEDVVGDLPYREEEVSEGWKEIVSIWEPNAGERAAIASGQNVQLGVGWIGAFPPVRLSVTPEGME